jgi:hypothetical protein
MGGVVGASTSGPHRPCARPCRRHARCTHGAGGPRSSNSPTPSKKRGPPPFKSPFKSPPRVVGAQPHAVAAGRYLLQRRRGDGAALGDLDLGISAARGGTAAERGRAGGKRARQDGGRAAAARPRGAIDRPRARRALPPPARTVYFLPLRLSTTVSVPRPPPGAGRTESSALVACRCSWSSSTASAESCLLSTERRECAELAMAAAGGAGATGPAAGGAERSARGAAGTMLELR